tara:strand:+ start:62 stop:1237 length:1176 start_codon:yes stop_codon:yes gene_type:complete
MNPKILFSNQILKKKLNLQMTLVATVLKLQPSPAILEDEDEKKYYWSVVLHYWKLPPSFHHFPGPNPISLERSYLHRLKNEDFLAALKTDGVRYLLVLTTKPNSTEPISLMIDRALNMYEIEIWANEEYFYNGCLLDGELVWSNAEELQFIVFDVVLFKGINCIEMNYRDRLEVIHDHVLCVDENQEDETIEKIISEEDKFCARNNKYNLQLFAKMCVSKQSLDHLWQNKTTCSHRNDGLILTLNSTNVHTGTSKDVLKWKPSHSIDIRCFFNNNKWTYFANDNSSDEEIDITTSIGSYTVSLDTQSKLLNVLKRKISFFVECLILVSDDIVTLIPERERTDKRSANTIKTIEATIRNAQEKIEIEELFEIVSCNSSLKTENVDITMESNN